MTAGRAASELRESRAYLQTNETERVSLTADRSPDSLLASVMGPAFLEYRKNWALTESFSQVPPWPLHLDVDTNYTCNLNCVMCPLGDGGFPISYEQKFLDFKLYAKVLTEGAASGLAAVRLGITGEPLLRPDILEFVRLARKMGLVDIMLITNGQLLEPDLVRGLIEAGLTRLMVSVDAADPESYRRIRRGGDFGRLLKNISDFLELRQKMQTRLPLLRVSFIKMQLNDGEMEEFNRFWSQRADYIAFQEYTNIMEREDTAFFSSQRRRAAGFRCSDPWQRMSLFVNGDLFPCCSDFGRLAPLGNVRESSVAEIWRSGPAQRLREQHRRGLWRDNPVCRRCAQASTASGQGDGPIGLEASAGHGSQTKRKGKT